MTDMDQVYRIECLEEKLKESQKREQQLIHDWNCIVGQAKALGELQEKLHPGQLNGYLSILKLMSACEEDRNEINTNQ